MTLQEILKAQGLTDEQIQTVAGEMKQHKIFTAGEENLDVRYSKLKADHDNLTAQQKESTALIEQLKAEAEKNEGMKEKFTAYDAQIAQLTKERDEARLESAMDRELMKAGAKATDYDYLKFQWRKKGEISLDENGEIKGANDAVSAMKTQFPGQFETASNGRQIEEHRLPTGDDRKPADPKNLAEALQQHYEPKN